MNKNHQNQLFSDSDSYESDSEELPPPNPEDIVVPKGYLSDFPEDEQTEDMEFVAETDWDRKIKFYIGVGFSVMAFCSIVGLAIYDVLFRAETKKDDVIYYWDHVEKKHVKLFWCCEKGC